MKATTRTIALRARTHDTTMPLLDSMYQEFKDLSKKNASSAVSKGKITIVNRLLTQLRVVLEEEDSLKFLDLLDEDSVPQVSDVTLMLSQYVAAMQGFKSRFYHWNGEEFVWLVK